MSSSNYNESSLLPCNDGDCGCIVTEAKKLSELRTSSLIFSYMSDPCLMKDDKFVAVLIFESTEIMDNGKYTLNFEDENGGQLRIHFNISASQ